MKGAVRPAQASTRTASGAEITLGSTLNLAVAFITAMSPTAKYVVQYGDTLSGIAARFAVRGGWPALYAANRKVIGPDPDIIHPGAVLVLPGRTAATNYKVAPGDTLSAIAAELAVRGGWPALYAANRKVVGPDPNVIHRGTVLTVPHQARPSSRGPRPGSRGNPTPPPSPRPGTGHLPPPTRKATPAATGMPQWLQTVLLAAGLFVLAALVAEPVVVIRRRRKQMAGQPPRAHGAGPAPDPGRSDGAKVRIVMADHERLVVTCDRRDDTVYVLRPPGEDPRAIMRLARLVLPEDPYRELGRQLRLPDTWPIVMADHERLVVTCDRRDDTVYVLRPPGEDPRAIMRLARLVLPEDPYRELAEELGVAASWPLE